MKKFISYCAEIIGVAMLMAGIAAVWVTAIAVMYAVLVLMPVTLLTEDECLSKGYPKAVVTYNLNKYCMNLEGTVTVNVEELP